MFYVSVYVCVCKSWRQHPTRHQLYSHLPPITKTIQVRRTRHAGHCWRSRDELISDVLPWTPTYGQAKAGRPARTYIQQLCEDTECSPENLPEAMNDREKWRERVVALYGWPEQTIPLSVSARNQTKDFWTWNLAVSGSGKGTRKRVGWTKELRGSWRRASREASQQRVGVELRTYAVDSGDSRRQDRVQRRRLSQKMSPFQLLCGIFASNPR